MTLAPPLATALYAGLLGLLYYALMLRVIRLRFRHRVGIGDGGKPDLARAIRVHANFAEQVPFALLALALAETLGAAAWAIHALGAALLIGRLLHAWGLGRYENESPGRAVGTVLSSSALVVAALLCFGLALARLAA